MAQRLPEISVLGDTRLTRDIQNTIEAEQRFTVTMEQTVQRELALRSALLTADQASETLPKSSSRRCGLAMGVTSHTVATGLINRHVHFVVEAEDRAVEGPERIRGLPPGAAHSLAARPVTTAAVAHIMGLEKWFIIILSVIK
jgi:hypothetical protein